VSTPAIPFPGARATLHSADSRARVPDAQMLAPAELAGVLAALHALPGFVHHPGASHAEDIQEYGRLVSAACGGWDVPDTPGVLLSDVLAGAATLPPYCLVRIYEPGTDGEPGMWWREGASGFVGSRLFAGVLCFEDAVRLAVQHVGSDAGREIQFHRAASPPAPRTPGRRAA
jgi:hypothetical protein